MTTIEPGGPGFAAGPWFAAVVDNADLAEAWRVTTYDLRLCLVQSWLIHVGRAADDDRDELAAALAASPDHSDWADFALWRLGRWREQTFADFVDAGPDAWGVASIPETVGADLEFVRIVPIVKGETTIRAGVPIMAQTLTMRLVDGEWLVAGIGRTLPTPGWPPSEETLPSDMSSDV